MKGKFLKNKSVKEVLTTILVMMILVGNTVVATGTPVTSSVIYLPKNQSLVPIDGGRRTCDYNFVKIKCVSVYPPSGEDNYTKIQIRVKCGNISMNSWTPITEGADYTKVYMKDGYGNISKITYQLRGNNAKYDAYTVVTYDSL